MENGKPHRDLLGTVLGHRHATQNARVACDSCLEFVARFIAKNLNFNVAVAESHDAGWYRDEVGEDVCSPERAEDLRTMVIVACHLGAN